jgi:preprotein translocase subunit YajC
VDLGSLILLLIAVGMLVLLFTRVRNQQRETASVQAKIAPGAEVMTGGGLFATVIEMDDDVVVLETGPGQHSRWDRRAVARVITEPGAQDPDDQDRTSATSSSVKDSSGDGSEDSSGDD